MTHALLMYACMHGQIKNVKVKDVEDKKEMNLVRSQ